jgi:hypothetical protein
LPCPIFARWRSEHCWGVPSDLGSPNGILNPCLHLENVLGPRRLPRMMRGTGL